jgi:hypothetical protein
MSRYVVAENWGHIFSDREGERYVRFLYDADAKAILAMDLMLPNSAPVPATDVEIADVMEELATTDNLEYSLQEAEVEETDDVPEWARSRVSSSAPGL